MTEDFDQPRPRRTARRQRDLEPTAAEEAGATGAATEVATEAAPPGPESQDIGNWKYRNWRGRDMWVNPRTHETLFDKAKVRKRRHQ
jgi:hypothetical protein